MGRFADLLVTNQRKQSLAGLRPKLYRVAMGWCGNRSLADDLVQEATYKALKSLTKLDKTEALEGWVFKILNNCFQDFCRQKKVLETPDALLDEARHVEEKIDGEMLVLQVHRAVNGLKQNHREVLVLIDLGGFSYSETAGILNLPIGTVMSRLNRARQQLKGILLKTPAVLAENIAYMERVK